ncbi:MAG: iron-containing alcohol dehydrogenase [Deltaproteobacteria bacterium]|nr:iron-containing alcohol dehydrogenase [Deltaproteobacteria bacterium]
MNFEFATAGRIIFGNGTIKKIPSLIPEMGRRALLVTGQHKDRAESLIQTIQGAGVVMKILSIPGEPTIHMIMDGVTYARRNKMDIVIGIGGGSVIDSAKAIAALLTNTDDIMEYLEVIGKGKPLVQQPAPCIAIPTTAGTGAEVTKNAVLSSSEHKVKVSLRSPSMIPDLALIDPELTYSMTPSLTAATGLDAMTQLLESFVSTKSNPLTDALCLEGLKRAARSLGKAYKDGTDSFAREDMAIASLFSGLALANSGLGAVHGMAAPMGGMFQTPHGVICARLLPFVMEANIKALKREGAWEYLSRYDQVAKVLLGKANAKAKDGTAWVESLCALFDLPKLSDFDIAEDSFKEIVSRSKMAGSMKGNPIRLHDEDFMQILQKAIL